MPRKIFLGFIRFFDQLLGVNAFRGFGLVFGFVSGARGSLAVLSRW